MTWMALVSSPVMTKESGCPKITNVLHRTAMRSLRVLSVLAGRCNNFQGLPAVEQIDSEHINQNMKA